VFLSATLHFASSSNGALHAVIVPTIAHGKGFAQLRHRKQHSALGSRAADTRHWPNIRLKLPRVPDSPQVSA